MSVVTTPRAAATGVRDRSSARDRGITLVEVLVSTVLVSVLAGGVFTATSAALRVADTSQASVTTTNGAGALTNWWTRDNVSAATATDGDAGCQGPGTSLIALRPDVASSVAVTDGDTIVYARDQDRLLRRTCRAGSVVSTVELVAGVTDARVECGPGCDGTAPRRIVVSTRHGDVVRDHQVTAAPRGGDDSLARAPEGAHRVAVVVPGGPGPGARCPVIRTRDGAGVTVAGDVVVGGACPGAVVDDPGVTVAGSVTTASGAPDPYGLAAPTCDGAGATSVHRDRLEVTEPVELTPGRHVLCGGLEIAPGGRLSGRDVTVEIVRGPVVVAGELDLTAADQGPLAGVALRLAVSEVDLTDAGAATVDGTVHAPDQQLRIRVGPGPVTIDAVVAARVEVVGPGEVHLGPGAQRRQDT